MRDPHLALQEAVLLALKDDAGVQACGLGGRLYDEPPAQPTFPYLTFGEGQVLPDKADCVDGSEVFLVLDIWSRPARNDGFQEAKAIAGAVVAALDDAGDGLTMDGHRLLDLQRADIQYLRDPDGKTRHVHLTFRAVTERAV